MKVGILQFFSWSRRVPLETVYERALERVDIVDEGGYDAVWLAEHHFNTYSVCPSVTVMASHVAARTRNIRIGTAVTLAAFYNPLRLAEELAMVDMLSGGRLNWGAGRGFDPTEFRAFDVPVEESSDRFRECVEIVRAAWLGERLEFHGKYWDYTGIDVLPRPFQQPEPPVWLAATSPDSINRAAEGGYSILMDPHASHVEIGRKRQLYRDAMTKHGHTPGGRDIPVARLVAVDEDPAEAERIARQGASWTVTSYANPSRNTRPGGVDAGVQVDPVERYVRDVIVHGTPDAVVDQLQRLQDEISLDYLLCAPLSHGSFKLFTERVLPRIAG
ncbi:MAG: LLM class flavin-dependent oxidoreductase [Dehalococcoidia bacterium]|nr:LLM class flavin-dependent oxidoreductase [Dehalococcoidia bacterium]